MRGALYAMLWTDLYVWDERREKRKLASQYGCVPGIPEHRGEGPFGYYRDPGNRVYTLMMQVPGSYPCSPCFIHRLCAVVVSEGHASPLCGGLCACVGYLPQVILGVYHALDLPKYQLMWWNVERVGDVLEATLGECLMQNPDILACAWDYKRWLHLPWDLDMENPKDKSATYLCALASAVKQYEELRGE